MLVPLLELVVLIEVGQLIGVLPTILLVVATSVLGVWLLRHEGRRAWLQFRSALDEGRWPGDEVAHGALVVLGSALLVVPGFVTDAVGLLLLLVAPLRRILARLLRRRFGGLGTESGDRDRVTGGRVVDVEVVEIRREGPDDGPAGPRGPAGDLPSGRD